MRRISSALAASLMICGAMPVAAQPQDQYKQMEAAAKKDFPNEPLPDALVHEALKQQQSGLAATQSENEKADFAARTFMGYYLVNARSRLEYCRNLGVDVSAFVSGFKAANRVSFEKATLIISRNHESEEQIYAGARRPLLENLGKVMADVAAAEKISTAQLCQRFQDHPEFFVPQWTYERNNPAGYNILLNTH